MAGEVKKKRMELNLAGRGVKELPPEIAQKKGNEITKLDLSDNELQSGKSLGGFTVLEELVLDRNNMSSLQDLPFMETLTILWINNNQFEELEPLCNEINAKLPNLTYLSMLMNPATPNFYMSEAKAKEYELYRYFVISRIPSLQFLDSTPVTEAERKQAARYAPLHKKGAAAEIDPAAAGPSPKERIGADNKPVKSQTFLAKSKPRYDGANSEGNRFIMNDDL